MINLRLREGQSLASRYTGRKCKRGGKTENSDATAHAPSPVLLPYNKDRTIVSNALEALLCVAVRVL